MENWKDKFPKKYIYYETENGILYNNDVLNQLKAMPDECVDCVITSPPYWSLRDYNVEKQIGLENDFKEYLEKLWSIFDEVYRILKPTGTCWVNLGDSYANKKHEYVECDVKKIILNKSLYMIPERFAIGMIEKGWLLRNQIVWEKPNAMPSSAKDRFTVDFEKVFFFTKQQKYYFKQIKEPNQDKYEGKRGKVIKRNKLQSAMRTEGYQDYYGKGRNKRTVWRINTKPFKGAHFAVFPPELPKICIEAGCPEFVCGVCGKIKEDNNNYCICGNNKWEKGIVMDIFMGSGTTAEVSEKLGRNWIGIELNSEYCEIIKKRIEQNCVNENLF